jgi:ABC-2 type transport system permease protein
MNALISQTRAELTLFVRDRTGVFFTILMPLLMVFLFGYLNRGREANGVSYASFLLAGGIGIVVAGTSFEVLGTTLARERDDGILKRLGGTPLRASTMIEAKMLTSSTIILTQAVIMVGMTTVVFEAEISGSLLGTVGALGLGIVTFTTMGIALAVLCRNAGVAAAAAHAVALPMQFLCGTLFPLEVMPQFLQNIARVLPMTYFVDVLRGQMLAGGGVHTYAQDWIIISGCLVVSFAITIKAFRWCK